MITLPRAYEIYAILRERLLRKKRLLNKSIFFTICEFLHLLHCGMMFKKHSNEVFLRSRPLASIRFCLKTEIFVSGSWPKVHTY